jgi:hypothetical protein
MRPREITPDVHVAKKDKCGGVSEKGSKRRQRTRRVSKPRRRTTEKVNISKKKKGTSK